MGSDGAPVGDVTLEWGVSCQLCVYSIASLIE